MVKHIMTAALVGSVVISAAKADPGQGIHSGPWVLSPYLNEAATFDSNVEKTGNNPKDDYYLSSEAGLKAGYSAYMIDISGLGFLGYRNYSDLTEKNFSSGGEILKFKQGTHDTVVIEADQSFRKLEDIDLHGSDTAVGGVSSESVLDASASSRRDINNVGISAGRNMTDKMQLDVGYRFDDVNYTSPDLYDLQSHIGQAETAYRMTDKTDALLTLRGGVQDNGVISDPADFYNARLGLKTRGTDKLTFKGGAGVQQFNRSEASDVTAFNYDVVAQLVVTEKLVTQVGGRNGTLLSSLYTSNGSQYDSLWAGVFFAVSPTVFLSGNVAFRRDNYLDPVKVESGTVDRVDEGTAFRVRADYQTPAKFLKLFSQASYETVSSTAVPDYNETRVDLGVNLQY